MTSAALSQKEEQKEKKSNALSEFMTGSRKNVAMGLGAVIMMLSGGALANEVRADQQAEDPSRVEQKKKVSMQDVHAAYKSFEDSLDFLTDNPQLKTRVLGILDSSLKDLDNPSDQIEAIELFRKTVEQRAREKGMGARKREKQEGSESVEFQAGSASGTVRLEQTNSGETKVVLINEGRVGIRELINQGVLKPNFLEFTRGKNKASSMLITRIEAKTADLYKYMQAQKAAEEQGKSELARKLQREVDQKRRLIDRLFGDVLI